MDRNARTSTGRLRLLAVDASMIGGGAERQMLLLLAHLDRKRFAPTLCLLAEEGPLLPLVPDDVPVVSLAKRSRYDLPRLVVQLARLLRAHRPDLVFSTVDYTNSLVMLAACLARTGVPVVVSETSVQSKALRDMSFRRLRRAVLKWAYGRAARVLVHSPGVEMDLRERLGFARARIIFLPNMLDLRAVRRAAEEPAHHRFLTSPLPLVVTAGRLHPAKGQADLIEAVVLLNAHRPCNLLLLGEGADRMRLEERARDSSSSDRIDFAGFVPNPHALVGRADIFVSPSHFESFGNAIVEAMAIGVPVVSTKVPAGPEWIISDRVNGVFASPNDPRDLADKIELVLRDGDLRGRVVERAREHVKQYDVRAVVSAYERLFADVARNVTA